jgi:hypothetical protein
MYPHVRQLKTRPVEIEPRRQPRTELRAHHEPAPAIGSQGPARPSGPPRHKLALLTWAGAYAVITAILATLGPTLASWPLALRTLAISGLMILALTWMVMPPLTRMFHAWLAPDA